MKYICCILVLQFALVATNTASNLAAHGVHGLVVSKSTGNANVPSSWFDCESLRTENKEEEVGFHTFGYPIPHFLRMHILHKEELVLFGPSYQTATPYASVKINIRIGKLTI